MSAQPASQPTELVPVFLKRRGERDEIRFVPTCSGCGELVLDISEANVAVVGGASWRPRRIGTHKGAKVSRLEGRAFVFCWPCDRKQGNNVPWAAAALTFRDRDDSAQQRFHPTFRGVAARKVAVSGEKP